MNIGALNQRVILQENRPITSGAGQEKDHWVDIATLWASVCPTTGREYIRQSAPEGPQTLAIGSLLVGLRPVDGLDGLSAAIHRFLHKGRVLDINHFADLASRRREWQCACSINDAATADLT